MELLVPFLAGALGWLLFALSARKALRTRERFQRAAWWLTSAVNLASGVLNTRTWLIGIGWISVFFFVASDLRFVLSGIGR